MLGDACKGDSARPGPVLPGSHAKGRRTVSVSRSPGIAAAMPADESATAPDAAQQRGRPAVQFVRALLDVGQYIRDTGQRSVVGVPPVQGCLPVGSAVRATPRHGDRAARRRGRIRFRIRVDGQVAVGAEVTFEEVADAAGQRVRGQPLQREGGGSPIGRSAAAAAPTRSPPLGIGWIGTGGVTGR